MNIRILLFELAKLVLVALVIGAICFAFFSAAWLIWFLVQLVISPAPTEFILQVADTMADSWRHFPVNLLFVHTEIDVPGVLYWLFRGMTGEEAKANVLRYSLILGGSVTALLLARLMLRELEYAFKNRFVPGTLDERFTEVRYSARKKRSADEPLCRLGLLYSVERYYTANRLEGIYRSCWVAAEELVCGGVYLSRYTSHRVKVRGQWLTVRLNYDFEGEVVLESIGTKNRLSHQKIARRMSRIEFDRGDLAYRFQVYSDSPELAQELISWDMAEKLVKLLDDYPDLCVVLENGCIHFLVRRRAFDRRWEYLVPFCLPWLRLVNRRVYGPLMDVTDALLEGPETQQDGA